MKKIKKIMKVVLILLVALIVLLASYILLIRTLFARSTVKDTLSAITTGDYTENFYYIDAYGNVENYLDISELEHATLLLTKMDVEDYDFKWNSIEATVTISTEYPDVAALYQEKYGNSTVEHTSEEMRTDLLSALEKNNSLIYREETIEVKIVQNGTKWYMIENEALQNVYTGGMLKLYQDALQKNNVK